MAAVPPFASASEAIEVARAALSYLADTDPTGLTSEEQADCLRGLEKITSVTTAARSLVLGAFTIGKGYSADADYSPRAWLIHKTGITRGAAGSYTAWSKRAAAHPEVSTVLAAGDISESFARTVCVWTDKLPPGSRDAADGILMAAAVAGLGLPDLAVLASEMLARCWQPDQRDPAPGPAPEPRPGQDGAGAGVESEEGREDQLSGSGDQSSGDGNDSLDDGRDEVFEDRALRLLVTFQGAGVLHGDLTPECAEIVNTVLDALAAPAGPEDTRDQAQRYHDALQEAMTRLLASGLLPQRGGAPVKAWVNISLADLMALDGTSELLAEWTARLRSRHAAHRAASAGSGGDDGGAWMDGAAAEGLACDAMAAPVVTGDVDPDAFDQLVRLCVQLDRLTHGTAQHGRGPNGGGDPADRDAQGPGQGNPTPDATPAPMPVPGPVPAGFTRPGAAVPGAAMPGAAGSGTARSREALEQAIVGQAAALLSGPGGLASFLRRRQLGARLAGPSLPLDIGYSDTVPAGIRNAVRLRDKHCQWAGGCHQPAAACDVHHTTHKADGGPTSVKDCVLLCRFHHLIVIHRWGWTLVVNPDGSTTAWNKDKTRVLHSHSPPARAG